MKYWFFDGNDVIGPFTPRELAARADFSVDSSLVCPENFSEDGDSWKPAVSFADFGPDALPSGSAVSGAAAPAVPEPEASSDDEAALFDKEMDTFLKNPSILAGTAAPAPEGPALEIPKKPAKPGPIEDYFNNINGEDLGDILGIPDPNENSDMNLPLVVDGHFERTAPPADKEIDFGEDEPEEDEAEPEQPSPPRGENSPASRPAPIPPAEQPLPELKTVKREDPVLSVPISAAEEELCVVLPGKSAAEELPAEQDPPLPPQEAETPALQSSAPEEKETSQAASAEKEFPAAAPDGDTAPAEEENSQTEPEPSVQDQPREEPPPVCSPVPLEEETLSICTLPVIGERENASLPAIPEDGAPVPPEPAPADFAPQREASPAEQETAAPEEKPSAPETSAHAEPEELAPAAEAASELPAAAEEEDLKAQTVRNILRGKLSLPPGPEELKEPLKTVPVEPSLNQVKTKLKQTPEIERFLDTQSRVLRRSRNKKAGFMLWVLAALLAVGVIFMSLRYLGRPEAESEDTVREAGKTVSVSRESVAPARTVSFAAPAVPAAARSALETPAPPPAPPTAADKALAAVQNHQLPGGKGTVASYFDRIYKTQLAQGYTGDWSAEALHKNTYIVKYRLSKTRMEPVVYVFQADAVRGKLTGALNNAALDLVGKI